MNNQSENPFETALRGGVDDSRRSSAPTAPMLSPKSQKVENPSIPPLLPGLVEKNVKQGQAYERPVERILRNAGKDRDPNDRNVI